MAATNNNTSTVKIKQRSRLQFASLLTIDNFVFWDLLQLPVIVPQRDDIFYTITGSDRIDLLAFKFYGDPILWWIIAAANSMESIPTDFNVGAVIRIPSTRYVTYLFKKYGNVSAGNLNAPTALTSGSSYSGGV